MLPRFTRLDLHNGVLAHAIFNRYRPLTAKICTYGAHLILGKPGRPSGYQTTAALSHHVAHVVCMRSKKQVLGVATSPIITAVQNHNTVWDSTVMNDPHNAVGLKPFTAETDIPVAVSFSRAGPIPTVRPAIQTIVKPRDKAIKIAHKKDVIEIHRAAPWLGARVGSSASNALPPALSTQPAAFTQAA